MSSSAQPPPTATTSAHSKKSPSSAGGALGGRESHRAPSALMTSIFSPPLTLSQTAVAEAGVLALSAFAVPPSVRPDVSQLSRQPLCPGPLLLQHSQGFRFSSGGRSSPKERHSRSPRTSRTRARRDRLPDGVLQEPAFPGLPPSSQSDSVASQLDRVLDSAVLRRQRVAETSFQTSPTDQHHEGGSRSRDHQQQLGLLQSRPEHLQRGSELSAGAQSQGRLQSEQRRREDPSVAGATGGRETQRERRKREQLQLQSAQARAAAAHGSPRNAGSRHSVCQDSDRFSGIL